MSTDADLARIREAYERYAADPRELRRRDERNRGLMRLMREWHDALLAELAARGLLRSSVRVLDAGCGNGWLLARLAEAGVERSGLHGIELIPERVAAARAKVPGAAIVEGSAHDMPYPDASFDVVCLAMVLSSIRSSEMRRHVADECRRVLAPCGVIACYELRWVRPSNREVEALTSDDVGMLFGGMERSVRTLSLVPPLARRLGPTTRWLYRPLASLPVLRSRHLTILSAPASPC
ncbi:MAG TPA: methyltransferase domain-containing protein [Solirubrobacteraceae bacterium]